MNKGQNKVTFYQYKESENKNDDDDDSKAHFLMLDTQIFYM